MSLPLPHIQALSSYRPQRREAPSQRNASSPFSLAIPLRRQRESATPSTQNDIPPIPSIRYQASTETLQLPQIPKKAVLVAEKSECSTAPGSRSTSASSKTAPPQKSKVLFKQTPSDSPPSKTRNDRVLALSVTLTLTLLLLIGIPLAAILPQKLIKPLPINILVPLYTSPVSTWRSLTTAIIKHESTNFLLVISPSRAPDQTAAIEELIVYPNVQVLGYIDTARGNTPRTSVSEQISAYASLTQKPQNATLHGVFLDHTQYNASDAAAGYLYSISAGVAHEERFGASPIVVVNPGRMLDGNSSALAGQGRPNITVVFEGPYAELPTREEVRRMREEMRVGREEMGMFVHSVPKEIGKVGLRRIVERVRRDVEWVYVSSEDNMDGVGNAVLEEWLDVLW